MFTLERWKYIKTKEQFCSESASGYKMNTDKSVKKVEEVGPVLFLEYCVLFNIKISRAKCEYYEGLKFY